jgi:uncharacterized protein (TIGR03437 family)
MLPRPLRLSYLAAFACLAGTPLAAQQNRIPSGIDARQTVVLSGRVHPRATPAADRGAVEDSFAMPGLMLLFKPSSTQQAALEQLLAQQQDPSSPKYHQWLTPEQYADGFGLSPADLQQVGNWIQAQGFTITDTARSRTWIAFSGTAGQVRAAFGTPIHSYLVDGQLHYANSADPSLPAALASVVGSILGLHDFRLKPHLHQALPAYDSGGTHYIAPGDLYTIYDINPLYSAGVDGTGQKLAIVGQTAINPADITNFRTKFGLPAINLTQRLCCGQSPGITSDLPEADLDIEWAGTVARNAQIVYVYSGNVMYSIINAVDNAVAPVVSMSYGLCEPMDLVDLPSYQALARQANAQGMTWVAASGDTGAADCEITYTDPAQTGLAVDEPASIPEVTAVGGTMFNEGSGAYWSATNGTYGGSALRYIPEMTWNETQAAYGLAAGGGGGSVFFPQPAWQSGPGVPNDGLRHVPDVAFNAAGAHDSDYLYSGGTWLVGYGGTSFAAPVMAGVVTLLNQYLTVHNVLSQPGLGNINPTLYRLAQNSPAAFHDVTAGNNIVPCVVGTPNCTTGTMGFSAGAGYDQTTGLGSLDVNQFVTNWAGSPAVSAAVVASIDQNPVFEQLPDAQGNRWDFTLTLTEEAGIGATLTGFSIDGVDYSAQIPALFGSNIIPARGSASALVGLASVPVPTTVTFVFSGVDANGQPWTVQFPVPFAGPQTQLSVGGIANAASYQQAYAPGMLVAVFGSALGSFVQSAATIPLPQYLAGFYAFVSWGTAEPVQVPLWYVSPGQVNLQIPYEVPTSGLVTLSVFDPYNSNGVNYNMRMSPAAPGIFTDGSGNAVPYSSGARGLTVTLYITGDGLVSPSLADGDTPALGTPLSQLPRPRLAVSLTVGGVQVPTPLPFIGINTGLVGVTQINFTIPTTAPLGRQPVVVTVGTATSLPAYITVTN